MKRIVVVVAALALVAVVSATVALSGVMVQAGGSEVKETIKATVKLDQKGDDVAVRVKANGLLPDQPFQMRPYVPGVKNCMAGMGNALATFNGTSDADGRLKISGTIADTDVDDVGSVSIRSSGMPPMNPPVVCFQDTTP